MSRSGAVEFVDLNDMAGDPPIEEPLEFDGTMRELIDRTTIDARASGALLYHDDNRTICSEEPADHCVQSVERGVRSPKRFCSTVIHGQSLFN